MPARQVSYKPDPRATGSNGTHKRLRQKLLNQATVYPYTKTLTSLTDGAVIKLFSSNEYEAELAEAFLLANTALNYTNLGHCTQEINIIYQNVDCDTHTGYYNNPTMLAALMLTACSNITSLLSNETQTALDHFCDDAVNEHLYAEHKLHVLVGALLLFTLTLCACGYAIGTRRSEARAQIDRSLYQPVFNGYQPPSLPTDHERSSSSEDHAHTPEQLHRDQISRRMNGLAQF